MILFAKKTSHTRIKKILIIVISSIIFTVMVVILCISPIAKYLIEKHDEKYTGRQIKMDWVYLNPFTGFAHIGNLKIYESKSSPEFMEGDGVFFSAKGLSVDFAILKLLWKTIEISELTINRPKGIIIQNKTDLNFTDLIQLFSSEKHDTTPPPFHFSIHKIKVKNGEFYYRETVIPINYFIKEVNIESPGIHWDEDTINIKYSFLSGIGSGSVKGNFTINVKNSDYNLAVIVQKMDLNILEQYLKDLTNYGYFRANIDADFKSKGNFIDSGNVTNTGIIIVNDFHFGKTTDDDYASFEKLVVAIHEISPQNHIYFYDSIVLFHPFIKYERYDYLDNFQNIFGKNGANITVAKANQAHFNLIIEIADYIKVLARNFFQSDYIIKKLAINNGELQFNDFSLTEKFSILLSPLTIIADSVNRKHKRVDVSMNSGIQPYGKISASLSINPNDSGEFDMQYHLNQLPASLFNPYMITYTSFPLDRGTFELNGSWNVKNGVINSKNHLSVIDPRLSTRIKNDDTKWIPAPFLMALIRERGNVIDYEIPITGNLKDPTFHLRDVIFDILRNIFVKPATIPYGTHVKNIENEIEKSLTLKWEIRQNSLMNDQDEFVNKIVEFLINNPEASIAIYPMWYDEKEKESIQLFEAKKKYFLLSDDENAVILSDDDSLKVDKMSAKESLFVEFLNKQVADSMIFTIQEKCDSLIGSVLINKRFKLLNKEREDAFILNFRKNGVEKRVIIHSAENVIPYNGFSFYKIVYKGELPESLVKAYHQMNEYNGVSPRKRFEKERKKTKNVL